MRRGPRPARRAGFTLIELLIVVAILAILAALVAAGIGRVKSAAQGNVTNQTLTKLQLALDKQWKAVCDECRDHQRTHSQPNKHPDFVNVVRLCDDDVDRGAALWMHLNLRRAMPHTILEAVSDIDIVGAVDRAGNTIPPIKLKASSTFKNFGTPKSPKTSGDANTDSAALLYVILTQGGRGTSFAIDDAMQGAQTRVDLGGEQFEAFKDAYGTAIAFRRFYSNITSDSRGVPNVRSGLTITDPLDPVGKLALWKPAGKSAGNLKKVTDVLFPGTPDNTSQSFDGHNKAATPISAGEDRIFDLSGATDDAIGYRVMRQGNRGD